MIITNYEKEYHEILNGVKKLILLRETQIKDDYFKWYSRNGLLTDEDLFKIRDQIVNDPYIKGLHSYLVGRLSTFPPKSIILVGDSHERI